MEGDNIFHDVMEIISNGNTNPPQPTCGRVLEKYHRIEDINLADGEPLVLEWMVNLSPDEQYPYIYEPRPDVKRNAF